MGRYDGFFNGRVSAEIVERDGGLFAGPVRIWCSDAEGRLPWEAQEALNVGDHARLHRCSECGKRFIAHHAARLCSGACRKAAKDKVARRHNQKRRRLLSIGVLEREIYCAHCGSLVRNPKRRTAAYCSPACRQAAYRARLKPAGGEASHV